MPRKNSKYENLFKPNQKIGDWVVVSGKIIKDNKNRTYVECACSCGKKTSKVACHHLISGRSTRCEFCNRDKRNHALNPNWRGVDSIPKSLLTNISHSAIANNLSYDLTMGSVSALYQDTRGTCTLTGLPISIENGTATLVRSDPTSGYTTDNVMWVHTSIAPALRKIPTNDFISLCVAVADKHKF